MTNTEKLLKALLNEQPTPENVEIISRVDKYLSACCEGCGCVGLPEPITRIDKLLYELAEKLEGGGGGGGTEKPFVNTTKLTNLDSFCKGGKNYLFGTDANLDTRNVTSFLDCYQSCTQLVTAPAIDTRNATNLQSIFYGCTSLQEVPTINTSKCNNLNGAFGQCTSLVTIGQALDLGLCQVNEGIFENCTSLVNVSFVENNICNWFDIHWSANLSNASILSILKGCRKTLSGRHLKFHSTISPRITGNTELYTAYQQVVSAGWVVEFVEVT